MKRSWEFVKRNKVVSIIYQERIFQTTETGTKYIRFRSPIRSQNLKGGTWTVFNIASSHFLTYCSATIWCYEGVKKKSLKSFTDHHYSNDALSCVWSVVLLQSLAVQNDWRGRDYKGVRRHTMRNTPGCLHSMFMAAGKTHCFQCLFPIVCLPIIYQYCYRDIVHNE